MARSSLYLIWHAAIVVLLGCAGMWENASRKSAAHVGWAVHKALQLTTLAHMQQMEAKQVEQQADAAEKEAERAENAAESLEERAERLKTAREQIENREFYWHKLWQEQVNEAKEMESKAEEDAELYTTLSSKVATDIKKEEKDIESLRTVHSGLCGVAGFRYMCHWVGYATATREQVDAEQMKIHEEWQQAQEAGKREFLEELAVDMIDKHAEQYNRTATYLGKLVDWYQTEQAAFFEQAENDEKIANDYKQQAENFRKQEHDDVDWQKQNTEQANAMLHRAQRDRNAAHSYAIGAVLVASLALVLALCKALPNSEVWFVSLDTLPCSSTPDQLSIIVGIAHILLTLFASELNRTYVTDMDDYSAEKRAVLVFWIALCGTFLHAAVWIAVHKDSIIDWRSVVHWSCVFAVLIGVEVTTVKVVIGQCMTHPFGPANLLSIALGTCALLLLLPTAVKWIKTLSGVDVVQDASTMYFYGDNSTISSEISPLHTESSVGKHMANTYSTTPTEAFGQIDFGGTGRNMHEMAQQLREVPTLVSWSATLGSLLLPLELLLVSLALKYIHTGMGLVVSASHLILMEVTLLVVAVLLALVWTFTRPISEISDSMSSSLKLEVAV